MLGVDIDDHVESDRGMVPGLGLLGVATTFAPNKVVRRRQGTALGAPVSGYELHHGRTRRFDGQAGWMELGDPTEVEGGRSADGRILGTSLHGIFEGDGFRTALLAEVARLRGAVRRAAPPSSFAAARQAQHDRLADAIASHLDLDALDAIIGGI
jgi:adenosylcobyric acid synthase